MTSPRSREPGAGVDPHPTPAPRWRDLAASDRAWCGIVYVRAVTRIDMPPAADVRRALADLGRERPEIGRWTMPVPPRWRRVEPAERDEWLEHVIAVSVEGGADTDRVLALNRAPLERVPLRVLVGPDWIGVRMSHAMGDGWTVNTFLGHLLARAADRRAPVSWTVLSQRRRDLVIARAALTRLPTLAHAVRHRRELAGGVYEPAAAHADRLADRTVTLVSDTGFLRELRAVRDDWFPGTSAAVVATVGLRAALTRSSLPAPRPGFECLYNTRSEAAGTASCWGNWSAGVYIRPADDLSPAAVAAEMTRVRASGLAELAHASLRARARHADPTTVTMPRAEGAPRLTMSYTQAHLVDPLFPGLRVGETEIGTHARPNGVESVTVSAVECAGRLSVGLAFFPDIWDDAVVRESVSAFLAGPRQVLADLRPAGPA
ncbi:hypothetical protein SAMN05443575_0084 [Jatrophihabitans endophyticus]|uniref:Condensation domain-containing protein n=1 Tax=Jatrophihabitans endophyticus TaxID=1206085 RepID=A0A1M5C336_9ACTN|nr:hypothetical protein [Jatrophihabitans endophyticus]SHF49101.1 hypothetical protein SAMN05443575_0084 [Jatrophihabitans endophyticus]